MHRDVVMGPKEEDRDSRSVDGMSVRPKIRRLQIVSETIQPSTSQLQANGH